MKALIHSKTFHLAVIQAVGGLVVIALTELDMVGYVAMAKTVVDILLRLYTTEPIRSIT